MRLIALALAAFVIAEELGAQTWPVKPVRVINPFSPGGSLDLVARTHAKSMSAELGQQVIVENRPGAGSTILEVTSWNAFFAPAGTQEAIINRLNGVIRQGLGLAEARAVMEAQGLDVAPSTPAELGALVRTELTKWARVIKAAGIKPE